MIKLEKAKTIVEDVNDKLNKELMDSGKVESGLENMATPDVASAEESNKKLRKVFDKKIADAEKKALEVKGEDKVVDPNTFKESMKAKDRKELAEFLLKLKEQRIKRRIVPLHEDAEGFKYEVKYEKPLAEKVIEEKECKDCKEAFTGNDLEALEGYVNSLSEGDNITVTADLLNILEKSLEMAKKYGINGAKEEDATIVIKPDSKEVVIDKKDTSKDGEEGHPIQKGLRGPLKVHESKKGDIGTQIGFSHSENSNDETEFDVEDEEEAMKLFKDFCDENKFKDVKVLYVEHRPIEESLKEDVEVEKMSVEDYLALLGIEVLPEVLEEIHTTDDVDAVMDASYLYNKNTIGLDDFNKAKEYIKKYFNDEIDEKSPEYVDLSDSLTGKISHYSKKDLVNGDAGVELEDTIQITGLKDSKKAFYDKPDMLESVKEEKKQIKVGDQGFIKKGSPFGKKGYTVTKVDGNSIEILSWDSTDRKVIDASEFEVDNKSVKEEKKQIKESLTRKSVLDFSDEDAEAAKLFGIETEEESFKADDEFLASPRLVESVEKKAPANMWDFGDEE